MPKKSVGQYFLDNQDNQAYETWAMYVVADVSKRLEEIQLLQTFAWYFSSLFAMTDAIECFKQI